MNTLEDERPTKTYDAFSFLMSRNLEHEAWKEATEAEKSKWGKMKKGKGKGKKEEIEEIEEMGEDGPLEMKVKAEKSDDGGASARRPAPFYKVIQGMPIAVDAFRYGKIPGVTAYLLTWVSQSHNRTNVLLSKIADTLTRTITLIYRQAGSTARYIVQKQLPILLSICSM